MLGYRNKNAVLIYLSLQSGRFGPACLCRYSGRVCHVLHNKKQWQCTLSLLFHPIQKLWACMSGLTSQQIVDVSVPSGRFGNSSRVCPVLPFQKQWASLSRLTFPAIVGVSVRSCLSIKSGRVSPVIPLQKQWVCLSGLTIPAKSGRVSPVLPFHQKWACLSGLTSPEIVSVSVQSYLSRNSGRVCPTSHIVIEHEAPPAGCNEFVNGTIKLRGVSDVNNQATMKSCRTNNHPYVTRPMVMLVVCLQNWKSVQSVNYKSCMLY